MAARPGIANRTVVVYLLMALAICAPGLVLKAGLDLSAYPAVADPLQALQHALADITFGSGLRFWLGVAGATMMAMLLLYPLRKVFGGGGGVGRIALGRISGWFHAHILLGILGPVLILYHCNFGHGGANANVALWTMLVVAGSGVVGLFIYGRVSRDFYSARQQAHRHRDAIVAALSAFHPGEAWKIELISKLENFEADVLTPRQGFIGSFKARLSLRSYRRVLTDQIGWLADEGIRRNHLGINDSRRLRALIGRHLRAYFGLARSALSHSVLEQLWARWRMFHLPVFLIMVVAAVLHVVAVWGMDEAGSGVRAAHEVAPSSSALPSESVQAKVTGKDNRAAGTVVASAVAGSGAGVPVLVAKPRPVLALPVVVPQAAKDEKALRPQQPVARPVDVARKPSESVAAAPIAKPAGPVLGARPAPLPLTSNTAPVAPAFDDDTIKPWDNGTPGDGKAVYAELQRRVDTQPMSLGGVKPKSLAEQISDLQNKQRSGHFSHSEAETGFSLTGQHLKADCADCHKKPLREVRDNSPRQCIACHKTDDIHRGRRPACATCHTTSRWSEIIRKK